MSKGIIYKATNKLNGKCYIGKTIQKLNIRKKAHIYNALNNIYSTYFYNALKKYGSEKFNWKVLENNIPENELNNKEIFYINKQNSFNDGYNMTKGGDYSPMRYAKIREKITGENHWMCITGGHSEETKKKISNSIKKLYENDNSYRERVSIKTKEAMKNLDIRKKISETHKGKSLSDEHKNALSKSLLGHEVTKETRKKISQSSIGKKMSKESRERMSKAHIGKKLSEKTKEKMRGPRK